MSNEQRTSRQVICDTLIDMLEETPLYRIKVTELVKQSDVSRSTFYNNFDSIYDVVQAIEDDLFDAVPTPKQAASAQTEHLMFLDSSATRFSCRYVQQHARVYRVLLGPNGDPAFMARLTNRTRDMTAQLIKQKPTKRTEDEVELIIQSMAGSQWQMLRWWVNHIDEYSLNVIVKLFNEINNNYLDLLYF